MSVHRQWTGPVGLEADPDPPPGASGSWRAPYARVLLVPVAEATPEALREAWDRHEAWLDAAIDAEERRGRRVDGYLLLQLPAGEVPDDVERAARIAELDVRVCRKAVLRPGRDGVSAALSRVPVLGLPPAPQRVAWAAPAEAPEGARRIEAWLAEGGVEAALTAARAWVEGDDEAR